MYREEIMNINQLANRCGYFYNAYLAKGISCNNGYNCKHPGQTEVEMETGKCYAWSCPLAIPAHDEDAPDDSVDYDDVIVRIDGAGKIIPVEKWGGQDE